MSNDIVTPIPSIVKDLLLELMHEYASVVSIPVVRNSPGDKYFATSFGMHVFDDVSVPHVIASSKTPDEVIVYCGRVCPSLNVVSMPNEVPVSNVCVTAVKSFAPVNFMN